MKNLFSFAGGCRYRVKRFRAGDFLDMYIYPVFPVRNPSGAGRAKKRKPTREAQKKLNKKHAAEKFTRLAHANFTEKDLALELDYALPPPDRETAMKDLQKFLRKLRRCYKHLGIELKYLWVMEITKTGRIHFHLILSGGMDRDEIEQLWGHGWANSKRLQFDRHGVTALAHYMTKSHRNEEQTRLTYRSYNGSKNLIDPPPEISDSTIRSKKRARELADQDWNAWHELCPGYELSDLESFCSDEYGSVYIFARLRKEPGGTSAKTPNGKYRRGLS